MKYFYRYFETGIMGNYVDHYEELSKEELEKIRNEEISKLVETIKGIPEGKSDKDVEWIDNDIGGELIYETIRTVIFDLEAIKNGYEGQGVFIGEAEAEKTENMIWQIPTKLKDIVKTEDSILVNSLGELYTKNEIGERKFVNFEEYFDTSLATEILENLKLKNISIINIFYNALGESVFKYVSEDILNNKEELKDFIQGCGSKCYEHGDIWRYVGKEILSDKEFMIDMIQNDCVYQFGFLSSELQRDTDVQKSFIEHGIDNGLYFHFKSIYPILQDDLKEMVKQAYIEHINNEKTPSGYNFDGIEGENIPDELRNDADFMLELLKNGTSTERIFFEDVSSELANNREFVLSVLENTDADVNYDNIGLHIFKDDKVMDKIDFKLRERDEKARQQAKVLQSQNVNPKVKKLEELEALEGKIDLLTKETEHVLNEKQNNKNK